MTELVKIVLEGPLTESIDVELNRLNYEMNEFSLIVNGEEDQKHFFCTIWHSFNVMDLMERFWNNESSSTDNISFLLYLINDTGEEGEAVRMLIGPDELCHIH